MKRGVVTLERDCPSFCVHEGDQLSDAAMLALFSSAYWSVWDELSVIDEEELNVKLWILIIYGEYYWSLTVRLHDFRLKSSETFKTF